MAIGWTELPYDMFDRISDFIVAKVSSVNRIVYDVTSKPLATIETS